jgi:hypothetical protein
MPQYCQHNFDVARGTESAVSEKRAAGCGVHAVNTMRALGLAAFEAMLPTRSQVALSLLSSRWLGLIRISGCGPSIHGQG